MSETLILALGNPLRGDDGVGPAVLEMLRESGALPESVTLLDGGAYGLMTALLTGEYRRVIIVDAANVRGRPGEWTCFTLNDIATQPDEVKPPSGDLRPRETLHNASLTDALAMGKALGIALPEILICGIQPLEVGWLPKLSEPVQKAVPEVCEAILRAVASPWGVEGKERVQWLRS